MNPLLLISRQASNNVWLVRLQVRTIVADKMWAGFNSRQVV
jgi:hypothetical protein